MVQVVKAEMVLWTAGFVLLTLVINAPLLPWVLRVTGLNKGTHALAVFYITPLPALHCIQQHRMTNFSRICTVSGVCDQMFVMHTVLQQQIDWHFLFCC